MVVCSSGPSCTSVLCRQVEAREHKRRSMYACFLSGLGLYLYCANPQNKNERSVNINYVFYGVVRTYGISFVYF